MLIDLRQVIYALTDALDLVGVDEVQHGKRVGFMAAVCAEALGYDGLDLELLFHTALLHDCGVSSTDAHQHLVQEMRWEEDQVHCRVGQRRLEGFEAFRPMAPIVRYHHTPWRELPTDSLSPRDARFANLIFLVDRVDVSAAAHLGHDLLYLKDDIRDRIKGYSETLFAPDLIDAFLDVSNSEAFWMTLEQPHLERHLQERVRGLEPLPLDIDDLRRLAGIFAEIVDAKSRFTAEHSWRVAELARYLAERMGLTEEHCDKVEISALLHDLGKLRIPDEILEMPGKLDPISRSVMLRHSFETYQILNRIDGLGEIALWAAYHHDSPNGNGYPFHRKGSDLPLEARIIAVADVLQALSQDRPYRMGMSSGDALSILDSMARAGRLDADVVGIVARQSHACWECATGVS